MRHAALKLVSWPSATWTVWSAAWIAVHGQVRIGFGDDRINFTSVERMAQRERGGENCATPFRWNGKKVAAIEWDAAGLLHYVKMIVELV